MMLAYPPIAEEFAPQPLPYFERATAIYRKSLSGLSVPKLDVAEPKDPARRERCRYSFLAFCLEYFPTIFYSPNRFHKAFASELERLILSPAPMMMRKALAAPRGAGKTTVCTLALIWAAFYGHSKFALVLTANRPKATERLESAKGQILNNDLLMEDFPELCGPIRAFNGDARQAPPGYPWTGELMRLPNGVFVAGQGMDGAIAGALKDFARPDFILVDDMETVDSVKSQADTAHLRSRLFQEVLKLVPQDKHSVCLYICTIKRKACISDELTDIKQNPEWRGERIKALPTLPDRGDLWDVYMEWVKPLGRSLDALDKAHDPESISDQEAAQFCEISWEAYKDLTPEHKRALRFYAANRPDMDAGAELLDPERLPLWKCYYERATEGEKVFWCEIQNQPPEDEDQLRLNLELEFLEGRKVKAREGVVPAWASWLFITVDMGLYACHWEASACSADFSTSQLVTQGIQETNVNLGGRYKMADEAKQKLLMMEDGIRFALSQVNARAGEGWPSETGEIIIPALIGVDARGGDGKQASWQDIVFAHCQAAGPKWIALRGDPFTEGDYRKAQGRNWLYDQLTRSVNFNADYYKTKNWNALNMPLRGTDGSLSRGTRMFHENTPRTYLQHHTAEFYSETFEPNKPVDKSMRVGWHVKASRIPNHWWDTASMQFVLMELAPFVGLARQPEPPKAAPDERSRGSGPRDGWSPRERF